MGDNRDNVYEGSNSILVTYPFLNRLSIINSGLKPLALGMSIFLVLCYKKHRKLCKTYLFACILSVVMEVIIEVSRGVIVSNLIFISTILIYLREYVPQKIKRRLLVYFLPVLGVLGVFFWAVTVSRFGDMAELVMYKYPGEPMVNFSGILFPDLRNTTNGNAYFLSAFHHQFLTVEDKWNYIEHVTGINGQIFYTFVGGLVIEFGKILTMILAIAFFILQNKLINNNLQKTKFIVILIFFAYVYGYGPFLFVLQQYVCVFFVFFCCCMYYILGFRGKKKQEGSMAKQALGFNQELN